MAASAKIQLLVDADSASIDVIKQGISCLEEEGYEVDPLLFAPPGRESNRKWKRFISQFGITFREVPRATTYLNEPNDDAIVSVMMKHGNLSNAPSLALLTADADFITAAVDLHARGTRVVVLIPEGRIGVVKKYEVAGLQVIKLESQNAAPKVRAVLHEDGSGSVHIAEAYRQSIHLEKNRAVETFLEGFGLKADEGYLIQKCVKFWFENCSGSITVYPPQLATFAVYDVIQAAKFQPGNAYFDHLAFCVPVTAVGGLKKHRRATQTFGSGLAGQVWRARGPFMKTNSPTLVAEVLEQLGYVDEVNADLREPMFCFINTGCNTRLLRQMGMLPVSGDGQVDVLQKLRAAFLSNLSSGMWQVASNFERIKSLEHILRTAGLLHQSDAIEVSRDEKFAAMKAYVEKEGMPLMQTFDALALRILHRNDMNPTLRQLIEIE